VRVLAIDTSTHLGSVACVVDGQLRAEVSARVRARHGETVFTLLEQVLAHAGVDKAELDLIACGVGPGSFTGTRVGLAAAKGLAVALDRPIVGVPTLRALARAAPGDVLAPAVDAHKGEVFVAVYARTARGLVEQLAPIHGVPDAVAPQLPAEAVRFGSGARKYADVLPPALPALFDAPRASVVALEAVERFEADGPDDRATLEPLYVRGADAKLPQVRSDETRRS